MFDNCGVYDGKTAVPKPSIYEKWDTMLKFLEWYGVPKMKGFGIILIDDLNQNQYAEVSNAGYNTKCYKTALNLVLGFKLVAMTTIISTMFF